MSFTDIKTKSQGFTIVELLIVVVVIAILAAITIVSYNGITNRANQSASRSTASTVQKKIELYFSEVGNYPVNYSELTGDASKSYYLPSGILGSSAPTADGSGTKGTGYVQVRACRSNTDALTTANISGIEITYWTYGYGGGSAEAAVFTTLGTSSCSNQVALGA